MNATFTTEPPSQEVAEQPQPDTVADVAKLRRAIFALRDDLAQQRTLIAALRQDSAAAYGLLRLIVDRDRDRAERA